MTGPATGDLEVRLADSSQWLEHYEPELTSPGYNLLLHRRRTPFLMDMNGEVRHVWKNVRASGRAKLLPNGHLAAITDRGQFAEHDWDGRVTWEFRPDEESHFLHHDFAALRNGNYLLLLHEPTSGTDYLLEVDRRGSTVWKWASEQGLADDLWRCPVRNKTHINSVQEIPANRWYDAGHEAFRPGNILLSARNLNTIYIISRPGGDVVWRHDEGLDYQHEARMVPPGLPGAGHIQLFNNGYHNLKRYRRTVIEELDPVRHSIVWRFDSEGFFSSTGGAQQALPNGNLLVTSSLGGRVFEVTREGRVVWQWAPPFLPMRALRYAPDYTPQLAGLDERAARPVSRKDPSDYVDAGLYKFATAARVRRMDTGGDPLELLRGGNQCQVLVIPQEPVLEVGYGVAWRPPCRRGWRAPVVFVVTARAATGESSKELWRRTFLARVAERSKSEVTLQRETLSLAPYAGQTIDLCLSMESESGDAVPSCFVWERPTIYDAHRALERPAGTRRQHAQVLKHEKEQLEALGYIN